MCVCVIVVDSCFDLLFDSFGVYVFNFSPVYILGVCVQNGNLCMVCDYLCGCVHWFELNMLLCCSLCYLCSVLSLKVMVVYGSWFEFWGHCWTDDVHFGVFSCMLMFMCLACGFVCM